MFESFIFQMQEKLKLPQSEPRSISDSPQTVLEPSEEYLEQKDVCVKYFDCWSELEQVSFVEHLLSRMCHYQHGQINTYLKPMLQRDFISALPGKIYKFYVSQFQCPILIYNLIRLISTNKTNMTFNDL